MSSLVAMMMTGTKMRKANPPRFCNAATIPLMYVHLKGKCHEIFECRFFHEPVSPKSLSILSGPFQIFSQICRDIRKLKVHKIENFFDSDFGICAFSLLVMSKY
jgi:hypothetical protein